MSNRKKSDEELLRWVARKLAAHNPADATDAILERARRLRAEDNHFDAGLIELQFSWMCVEGESWGMVQVFSRMARSDFVEALEDESDEDSRKACLLNIAESYRHQGAGYYGERGEPAKGMWAFKMASKVFLANGNEALACKCDVMRAGCAREYGQMSGNRRLLERSVAMLRETQPKVLELGDLLGAVQCYCSMNSALISLGEPDEVVNTRDRAVSLCQRGGTDEQMFQLDYQYRLCTEQAAELRKLQNWGR